MKLFAASSGVRGVEMRLFAASSRDPEIRKVSMRSERFANPAVSSMQKHAYAFCVSMKLNQLSSHAHLTSMFEERTANKAHLEMRVRAEANR